MCASAQEGASGEWIGLESTPRRVEVRAAANASRWIVGNPFRGDTHVSSARTLSHSHFFFALTLTPLTTLSWETDSRTSSNPSLRRAALQGMSLDFEAGRANGALMGIASLRLGGGATLQLRPRKDGVRVSYRATFLSSLSQGIGVAICDRLEAAAKVRRAAVLRLFFAPRNQFAY